MVVLGHSGYYPRFGFVPASTFGLFCRWPVPETAFMAIELRQGAIPAGIHDLVVFEPEFDEV